MGVYMRNDNWYIDYHHKGKRIREKIGPNKKLAEAAYSKRIVEIAEGKYLDKKEEIPKITFLEMSEKYLEWSKANKKSWITDSYSLKKLNKLFGKKLLIDIKPFNIEGYKINRSSEVAKRTVNLELACFKHLYTKAIEWGFALDNPVKKVKMFRLNNARTVFE